MDEINYDTLLDCLYDGIYYVDNEKRVSYWNKAAERITGYSRDEVLSRSCSDNLLRHIDDNGKELCIHGCPLQATLGDGNIRDANVYLHHKDGHRIPVSVRVSPIRNSNNEIIGAVEIFSDNSSLHQIIQDMEMLKKEAYLDPLTNLGNRRYADMVLKTKMDEASRFNLNLGIIYFDIDHFKKVNDTYGHKAGDEVLVMVSKTLINVMRTMDAICRMGGEEFMVIVPNIDKKTLEHIAERIRKFIELSFIMLDEERKLSVTVSIGATFYTPKESEEQLLMRADKLMYHSKESGRNRITYG